MAAQRVAGTITFRINGIAYPAKGNFTRNLGRPKRTAIVGSDNAVHGFKEEGQAPFIEGEITDIGALDLNLLVTGEGLTITLELANGKVFTLFSAWFAGDGDVESEEGKIKVKFEGESAEEF